MAVCAALVASLILLAGCGGANKPAPRPHPHRHSRAVVLTATGTDVLTGSRRGPLSQSLPCEALARRLAAEHPREPGPADFNTGCSYIEIPVKP